VNWTLFEHLDRTRRLQGAMMDAAGLGPAETLYETAYRAEGISLRRYGKAAGSGPPILIVPAPIKRPYIWDLSPAVSAVRRCLAAPSRVFLVDWQRAAPEFGLGDYTERLILDCLNAIGDEPAVVLAHSLGGLFAAVFAALHPDRVRGLVLLAISFEGRNACVETRGCGVFAAIAQHQPEPAVKAHRTQHIVRGERDGADGADRHVDFAACGRGPRSTSPARTGSSARPHASAR
jgi:pimeloyl-ACP methyl ester carboxylesterase